MGRARANLRTRGQMRGFTLRVTQVGCRHHRNLPAGSKFLRKWAERKYGKRKADRMSTEELRKLRAQLPDGRPR